MSMAEPPPPPSEQFTHTGHRFVLGYDASAYAIWDRTSPGQPVRRYPRTTEGWARAWREYTVWEPQNAPVGGYAPVGAGAAPASPYTPAARYEAAPVSGEQYTSARAGGAAGLARAWRAYTVWEPQNAPVGGYAPVRAGTAPAAPYTPAAGYEPAPVSGKKYTSALVWGIVGLIIGPAAIAALVIGLNARR